MELYPEGEHRFTFKERRLAEQVEEVFHQHNVLIFVGAMGIAVRGISKVIKGKEVDPAVLVVDELGRFVIPVLSGHLGGANAYATELSTFLNSMPVITTATDINGVFAVDVWAKKEKLWIRNIDHIKYISSALLEKKTVGLVSEYGVSESSDDKIIVHKEGSLVHKEGDFVLEECGMLISDTYSKPFKHTLWMTPRKYVIGVGCRKDIDSAYFETKFLEFLNINHIELELVGTMATIELKAKEQALLDLTRKYGIEFSTFTSEELQAVEGNFHGSSFVQSITGVDNVCERSAKLGSGAKEIWIEKTACGGITFAVCIREGEMIV